MFKRFFCVFADTSDVYVDDVNVMMAKGDQQIEAEIDRTHLFHAILLILHRQGLEASGGDQGSRSRRLIEAACQLESDQE